MAERVGGVEFNVEVGTDGAIRASKAISAANLEMQNSFGKVDKAAKKAGDTTDKAGKKGAGGLRNMRSAAGQLGFQVQDMAVQLQSGTNAMVVLGQQGSQVASIFGPTGAVVGAVLAVAAAVGSALVPALSEASGDLEELPEGVIAKLDKLKAKLEETDQASLGSVARVEIDKLNAEYDKLIEKADRLDDLALETATSINGDADAAARLTRQAEEARKEAQELALTMGEFTKATLGARDGWEGVNESAGETSDAIRPTVELTTGLAQAVAMAEQRLAGNTAEAARLQAAFQFGVSTFEQLPQSAQAMVNRLIEIREQQKTMSEEKIAQMKAEKEAEQQTRERVSAIEQLREEFASERQLRAEQFLARGELLREALEKEEITKAEFDALEKQRVSEHQQWLIDKTAQAAQKRTEIEQKHQRAVTSFRNAGIQNAINLLDVFAGESKVAALASIALSKGLALAQNTQNTLAAQTRALAELGPIAGPPVAAKIGSYGAINAALIAATGLAQAGSALSGRGGGSFSGGLPATRTTDGQAAQGQLQQPDRNISIALTGSNFSGSDVRALIEQINDELGDGATLSATGG